MNSVIKIKADDLLFYDSFLGHFRDDFRGDFLFFADFFTDLRLDLTNTDFLFFVDFLTDRRLDDLRDGDFLLRDLAGDAPLHLRFLGHGLLSPPFDQRFLQAQNRAVSLSLAVSHL